MAWLRFNWFTPGQKKQLRCLCLFPWKPVNLNGINEYICDISICYMLKVKHDKTRLRHRTYRDSLKLAYLKLTDWFLPRGMTWVTWQKKMWLLARRTWMRCHNTRHLPIIMPVSHIVNAVGLSRMRCSLSPSPGHLGSYSAPRHRSCCPSEVLVLV